jgi:hypothetical protein
MRTETVEIYSDASNTVVMRHPGRQFPGVLIQGDTLHNLYCSIAEVAAATHELLDDELVAELEDARNQLSGLVLHYKRVMAEHHLSLPFNERSDA